MLDGLDIGLGRSLDHDHGQTEPARRDQLASRGVAAGILADEDLDPLAPHQAFLVIGMERAALLDDLDVVQGQPVADRLDGTDEIMMLRRIGEDRQFEAPDREEHPLGLTAKCLGRSRHVLHPVPAILGAGSPGLAADRQKRDVLRLARGLRVIGHESGKGVGRVDDGDDAFFRKIVPQPVDPAKTADANRQVGGFRVDGMPRQRDDRANVGSLLSEMLIERSRFAGSA